MTFFSPTNARLAFPCFDDPGLKANLTLTMVHAQNYTALGNMPAESATIGPDGLVTTKFATSPKISTYLVCFAVLDFPSIQMTSRNNNITVRLSEKWVIFLILFGEYRYKERGMDGIKDRRK